MSFSDSFLEIAKCKVHLGDTVTFWNDWWDLGNLKLQFPQLCSFAKQENISVAKFLVQDVHQNFFTPLSVLASDQLQNLSSLVQQLQANPNDVDSWSYSWNSSYFVVKKAYDLLKGSVPTSPVFWWMWQSQVAGKIKFFFWLLLKDRLNTRNLLRKNMHLDEYTCVLCQQNVEETSTSILCLFF